MALTPTQKRDIEIYLLEIYRDIFIPHTDHPYVLIEDSSYLDPIVWRARLWIYKEDYNQEQDANITLLGRKNFR